MKSILYIIAVSSMLFLSTAYSNPTSSRYGPVKGGETLWYIAYKHKPAGVTRWKMMRAIHIYNRSSFKNGDINLLQKGSILILPKSKTEVVQFINGTAGTAHSELAMAEKKMLNKNEQRPEAQINLKKANAELKMLRDELLQSRSALDALKKESLEKYSFSQQKIALLEQENADIRENKKSGSTELEKVQNEVALLKKQNDLLREQATTGDFREKDSQKKDKIVSETIAALNADIGQLRSRIKELEDLEKLKDAHIVELKKTLKHATRVIKDQDVLNKKMHAQLAHMHSANSSAGQVAQPQASFLGQKENKQAGVAPPLSDMVKSVSPKFWLILTLGGLLLVLTFLWRSLSLRNLTYMEDKKRIASGNEK